MVKVVIDWFEAIKVPDVPIYNDILAEWHTEATKEVIEKMDKDHGLVNITNSLKLMKINSLYIFNQRLFINGKCII
jgi:hypothetical protein